MNNQQLLYIGTLFNQFNGQTQFINITDKHGEKMQLEVYPSNNLVVYRVHFTNGSKSEWSTWESQEHLENYFRMASLL